MLGIFGWIWSGIKSIGEAIALPFLKVKSSTRLQAIFRWTFHAICVAGVLVGLWYLNHAMRLDTVLLTPYPILRSIWLPLVAIQLYAVSWIGWWLFRVTTSHREVGEFPDLDKAWRKVETALQIASINITETPLFLFLGKPEGSTADFLNAGRVARKIPAVPSGDDAPFHVYANDEAVYVCLEGTSLLGRQSSLFQAMQNQINNGSNKRPLYGASHFPSERMGAHPVGKNSIAANQSAVAANNDAVFESFAGLGNGAAVATQSQQATKLAARTDAVGEQSLALIESNIAMLEQTEQMPVLSQQLHESLVYQPKQKLKVPLLQDQQEIAVTTLRLKHLCRVISESRRPCCPINGVVVLIPYAGAENNDIANHTGMLIERDLEAISDSAMVDAPRLAVICDIQQIDGCNELLSRFPEEQRHRRLGIDFPYVPLCDQGKMKEMISSGLAWLCQKMVPPLVNRLFCSEVSGEVVESVNESNRRLYHFASEVRDKQKTFERIIRRAFLGNSQKEELLRGCYFSASGRDAVSTQGFTAGIFSQIHEMQNDASWTDEAMQREKELQNWSNFGYIGIATVAILIITSILV
ncbi:MAG: type VI secretion protein IcmF/TssM N-terminal domain-containing protein [Mariniblastus sp.]